MISNVINLIKDLVSPPSKEPVRAAEAPEFDAVLSSANNSDSKKSNQNAAKPQSEDELRELKTIFIPQNPAIPVFDWIHPATKSDISFDKPKEIFGHESSIQEASKMPANAFKKLSHQDKSKGGLENGMQTVEKSNLQTDFKPTSDSQIDPHEANTDPVSNAQGNSNQKNVKPQENRNALAKPEAFPFVKPAGVSLEKVAVLSAFDDIPAAVPKMRPLNRRENESGSEANSTLSKPASRDVHAIQTPVHSKRGRENKNSDTKQNTREHSANPQDQSPIKRTEQTSITHTPASYAKLSVEQLRELQALVQRALEVSRAGKIESGEVAFDWSQKEFGKLQFHIRTEESAVHIEIISDQPHVADMIQQSRAVVERMIQDQGLRIERFDVLFRSPSEHREPFSQSSDWSHRNSPSSQSPDLTPTGMPDHPEEAPTADGSPFGERVWVA